jgi:3-phosphoshikimate 1-carboxyvinyltransferase
MPLRFAGDQVWLGDDEVTAEIRSEAAGMDASLVSALPEVRAALVEVQHGFRRLPGLVADGRDMGTVIFPDAPLKVFLTADALKRAQRRHRQLVGRGIDAKIDVLHADLLARDARDSNRSAAPLKPAEDALLLDNSDLGIPESVDWVLKVWQGKRPPTLV